MSLTSVFAIEAVLGRETDQVLTALLELEHTTFKSNLLIANNTQQVKSNGRIYLPFPFGLTRPSQTDDVPEARLVMANVDQEVGQRLEAVVSPIDVTITIVLAETPNVVEDTFPGFELANVKWNALRAEGVFTQRQFSRELFPPRRMTETHGFPWMAKRR